MTSKSSLTAAIDPSASGTPPWLVPVWTLTLLIPGAPVAAAVQLAPEAVEIGPQLRLRRVLLADLADLPTDADRQPGRLQLPDESGQLGGPLVVRPLLVVDRGAGEVDQGGAVDVDVPVADLDRLATGAPDLLGHLLRVGRVLPGIELVVIALDEDGAGPARGDRPGQDAGHVLDRPLEGVGLLAPGELQDDGPDVGGGGRLVDGPGHVEGLGADVDRRDGEAADLAAGPGKVELLDAGRARRRAPGWPPRRATEPPRPPSDRRRRSRSRRGHG